MQLIIGQLHALLSRRGHVIALPMAFLANLLRVPE